MLTLTLFTADLCFSVVCLNDDLLESEEDLHHEVLKENGETGDRPTLLCMYLPVLSLVEHLNVWREREGGLCIYNTSCTYTQDKPSLLCTYIAPLLVYT